MSNKIGVIAGQSFSLLRVLVIGIAATATSVLQAQSGSTSREGDARFSVPEWHPSLRPPQELAAQRAASDMQGEGPFVGGVFDRPPLSADELAAYEKVIEAVQTPPRKPR